MTSSPKTPAPIQLRQDRCELRFVFEFLTPMFGGGVDPKAERGDPVTVVRGSSIRGQLRFWWRATQAVRFASLRELRAAEGDLFGSAAGSEASAEGRSCSIRVQRVDGPLKATPVDPPREVEYLSFPLRDKDAPNTQVAEVSGFFELKISVHQPQHAAELKAAVWAWATFGGLGGRTRRGFGALRFVEGDLDKQSLSATSNLLECDYIVDEGAGPPAGVPVLSSSHGARLELVRKPSAEAAWFWLADRFKTFRQGPNVGRNPGSQHNRPGRSRWPEPDLIRHDLASSYQGSPEHQTRLISTGKAPRAAFGLPIIFHFKGEREIQDVTLKPADKERLASPLILRPVVLDGTSHAVILVLGNREDPDSLGLVMSQGRNTKPTTSRLSPGEAGWPNSPLAGRSHDPLEAFLLFCKSR